jgi:competence protein ComEC
MTGRNLGHRAPLLWLVLPFIGGLAAGRAGLFVHVGWSLGFALIAALAAVASQWGRPGWWAPGVLLAMFFAGTATYTLQRARLPAWDTLPAREARIGLHVDRVFVARDARRASGLATVIDSDPHLRELRGQRLYFSLTLRRGEARPVRSARIEAVGVLVTLPRNPPADTFDGYLAGAGMNFRLTRGRVLRELAPAHPYHRFCARAAERFQTILGFGIAEKRPELAGLLRAMMLGATHELSDEQHTLFMQSGTMHLFAISGLNIGVIAGSLQALLLLLRLPAWARLAVGTGVLWLFVDITGASPSAVRAGAMAVFVQAAFVLRRPASVLAALVASAFAVVVLSPFQVFSASFLMSYGIVVALLVLGLPLADAWLGRWKPWRDLPAPAWSLWQRAVASLGRTLATALAIGVATTLVSAVTSVQFFRLLTPGALIANLVLIPAAMGVTLGGFAALLCGVAGFSAGAALCNHAAALLLGIIAWLVQGSVRLPGAFHQVQFAPAWVGHAALAALLGSLLAGYAGGWKRSVGGWWPPFAVVALALLFGTRFD